MMSKIKFLFFALILITIILATRFYNLNWGAPFYFHPDERNIASAVNQLNLRENMNPHFFAYGSLPIYVIYFSGIAINFLSGNQKIVLDFSQAIVLSRFVSAFLSTWLILFVFLIGQKIANKKTGFLAAILCIFSTGLTQFSHFGTFEMWLTFFTTLLLFFALKFIKTNSKKDLILLLITFGLLISIKISSLGLLPLVAAIVFWPEVNWLINKLGHKISASKLDFKMVINIVRKFILLIFMPFFVFIITNPFVVLDIESFLGSMKYESGVATGTLPVFYTGEFIDTLPIIYQFLYVYPFLLNPIITFVFVPLFLYLLIYSIKKKKLNYLLLIAFFLFTFLSQVWLFVKWTRYLVPTLPFVFLIISVAIKDLRTNEKVFFLQKYLSYKHALVGFIILSNIFFGAAYFITTFANEDTRIMARNFAAFNIPKDATILSEVYDLGITPFNDVFEHIKLFNFYEMDNNSIEYSRSSLEREIDIADYIIIPSQRILKTRLIEPKQFPEAHEFYDKLINRKLPFHKIYETPCDLFCRITYLNNPIYSFETTANVFDRPTVLIFKKI